ARNLLARCCVESRPSMRTNHRASARPGRVQYAQRSNSRRCLSSGYPMANLTSKPPTAPPAANIAALAVISDEYREKSLEPISKSSEEDNEASELYEAEEVPDFRRRHGSRGRAPSARARARGGRHRRRADRVLALGFLLWRPPTPFSWKAAERLDPTEPITAVS